MDQEWYRYKHVVPPILKRMSIETYPATHQFLVLEPPGPRTKQAIRINLSLQRL
jgi:hypothetical protein